MSPVGGPQPRPPGHRVRSARGHFLEQLNRGFGQPLASARGDARVHRLVAAFLERLLRRNVGGIVVRELDDERVAERGAALDRQAQLGEDLAREQDDGDVGIEPEDLDLGVERRPRAQQIERGRGLDLREEGQLAAADLRRVRAPRGLLLRDLP